MVLPPALAILRFHVKRKFLTVDTNSLFSELLCVFFNHIFTSLLSDFSMSLGGTFFLLHTKEAHLALIKTLFTILNCADVSFESSEVLKILNTTLFLKLNMSFQIRLVNPLEAWLSNGMLGLFDNFGQAALCSRGN